MLSIRKGLFYIRVEDKLVYSFKPQLILIGLFGGVHWLVFDLSNIRAYRIKRSWLSGYSLHMKVEEAGLVNQYYLPLPGMNRKQLKKLIDTINSGTPETA